MLDPIATIRELLLSNATLAAMVGGRITCPMAGSDGLPAVSFQIIGGQGHSEADIMSPMVMIKSWAPEGEHTLARAIDRAVYDAIGKSNVGQQIQTASGFVQSCFLLTPGQDLRDPDTKFSVVQSIYQFILNTV